MPEIPKGPGGHPDSDPNKESDSQAEQEEKEVVAGAPDNVEEVRQPDHKGEEEGRQGADQSGGQTALDSGSSEGSSDQVSTVSAESPRDPGDAQAKEKDERPGIFGQIRQRLQWGGKGSAKEQDQGKENSAKSEARARERRIQGYVEIYRRGANNPQELAEMMANISYSDLREVQIRTEYGNSFAKRFKAFMEGERDFIIHENQINDAGTLVQAGKHILSTIGNRRTAVSALVYLGIGAMTGGLGWAAGGVLLGGVIGRGAAEAYQLFSGEIKEARLRALDADKKRFDRIQELSRNITSSGENAEIQAGSAPKELVELMYLQGESALVKSVTENQARLAESKKRFDKIRSRVQTLGELAGGLVGYQSILNGGIERINMDLWNNIPGQEHFHPVQQTAEGWQFYYEPGPAYGDGSLIPSREQLVQSDIDGLYPKELLNTTTANVLASVFW